MKGIKMAATIFVHGVIVAENTILTVEDGADIKDNKINPREAKELIGRGAAVAIEDHVGDIYSIENDITKPIEKMNKSELLTYAESIGVEADDSMTKAEIIEVINAQDEE
ncbi:MAG TPA: hypothetical protein CFH81_00390 [Sulfurovum sp. UBA12169]|nr:MAG TPA: hypothetical protein CFH81_00390 [Sulfurovum sp. UBA12169]